MTQFVAVLVNGEQRRLELPAHTGTVANAIDRLDDWIATADGGWVHKAHIVEVRPLPEGDGSGDERLAPDTVSPTPDVDPA